MWYMQARLARGFNANVQYTSNKDKDELNNGGEAFQCEVHLRDLGRIGSESNISTSIDKARTDFYKRYGGKARNVIVFRSVYAWQSPL